MLRSIALTVVILVITISCSSSHNHVLRNSGNSNPADTMRLVDVAEPDLKNPSDALAMQSSVLGNTIEVSIVASMDFEADALTYHLHYDDSSMGCIEAELMPVFGSSAERLDFTKLDYPGVVGLGQVPIKENHVIVHEGETFAKLTFSTTRLVSASESNTDTAAKNGLALRRRALEEEGDPDGYDFLNQDICFNYWQHAGNQAEFTVHWEEANDGDYNNDGMVTAADLTTIGQNYDEYLEYQDHWTRDGSRNSDDWEMKLSRRNRNATIYNLEAKQQGRDGSYGPVTRHSSSIGPVSPKYNLEALALGPDLYTVTTASISAIGQYFGNHVEGYEVYLVELDGWENDTEFVYSEYKLGEVKRPNVDGEFNEPIDALGFKKDTGIIYKNWFGNPPNYSDCPILRTNSGEGTEAWHGSYPAPLAEERPLYMYSRDLIDDFEDTDPVWDFLETAKVRTNPVTEVFIAVVPIDELDTPIDGDTNRSIGSSSDWYSSPFTYLNDKPLDLSFVDDKPQEGPVYSGSAGIISATPIISNPEANRYDFNVTFNQASLPQGYSSQDYEVKYRIYYSFESGSTSAVYDANENANGNPLQAYYPSSYADPRDVIHDLDYSPHGVNIITPPLTSSQQVYLGVRAYIVNKWTKRAGPTEKNTATPAIVIFPQVAADNTSPGGLWLIPADNVIDSYFKRWLTPSGETKIVNEYRYHEDGTLKETSVRASEQNRCYTADVPHALNSTEDGIANVFGIRASKNRITDVNDEGIRTPDEELEVRVEIFRTSLDGFRDASDLEDFPGGVAAFYNARRDSDLFAVSIGWPYSDPSDNGTGTSSITPYAGWPVKSQWDDPDEDDEDLVAPWASCIADSPYVVDTSSGHKNQYLTVLSPLHLSDSDTLSLLDADWQLRNMNYWPQNGVTCMPNTEYLSGNLPSQYEVDYISLCGNHLLEKDIPSPNYRYVAFVGVNDDSNNSYRPYQALWLGEISTHGSSEMIAPDSIRQTLYALRFGLSYDHHGFRGTSQAQYEEIESQHRGYDMAYNAVNNLLGWTYVQKNDHRLILCEENLATGLRTCYSVCSASVGNTSLAYDSTGNPHVAYYLTNHDFVDDSGGGVVNPSKGGSSLKSSSEADWEHVYYREFDRTANEWSAKELVSDSAFLGSEEHTLAIDTNGVANCLVPYMDGTDAVAAISRSPSWSASRISGLSDVSYEHLDSVMIGDTMYAGIYNGELEQLVLMKRDSLGAWTTLESSVSGNTVAGHQDLFVFNSDRIGIAYQVIVNGTAKLAYRDYTISTDSLGSETIFECSDSGYHTDTAVDMVGNPVFISIKKDECSLMMMYYEDYEWHTEFVNFTDCTLRHFDFNNVSIVRVSSVDQDAYYCTYMGLGGGSALSRITL